MAKNNDIKKALLGMPYGTACAILRKSIIFWLAGENGMLNCYRCKKPIENIKDFSIEHKLPWQKETEPNKSFFDIENIAFSHIKCNIGGHNRSKTTCKNGHPYNRIAKRGERICRICHNAEMVEFRKSNYTKEKRHKQHIRTGQ